MAKIGTLIPLPFEQRVAGFTHIFRLGFADVATLTSGTAQGVVPPNTLALPTTLVIPAGSVVRRVIPRVVTAFAFSGADNGTLVYILGDGGSTNRFVASVTLKTAGWGVGYAGAWTYTADDTIDIIITAATQAITLVNAGQLDLYLEIQDASGLSAVVQPSAT